MAGMSIRDEFLAEQRADFERQERAQRRGTARAIAIATIVTRAKHAGRKTLRVDDVLDQAQATLAAEGWTEAKR